MVAILVGDLMLFTGDGKFCFGVATQGPLVQLYLAPFDHEF